MIKFFNKLIRKEKIIEKYASGLLHFIFPSLLYGKITLAQHSISGFLVVELGKIQYLTIEGKGEPAGKEFTKAVESLYPLAYGIKKICKNQEQDFSVPKLEGLWWVKSGKYALDTPRSEWYWKLLIHMPDFTTSKIFKKAQKEVFEKKKLNLVNDIKFEIIDEKKCIQIMHIGPYSTEPKTIAKMQDFMKENNYTENGLHHEIYLSDPRKTVPEKMKTILRQPVK